MFRLPQGTLTELNFYLQNIGKRRIKYTETNNTVKHGYKIVLYNLFCGGMGISEL